MWLNRLDPNNLTFFLYLIHQPHAPFLSPLLHYLEKSKNYRTVLFDLKMYCLCDTDYVILHITITVKSIHIFVNDIEINIYLRKIHLFRIKRIISKHFVIFAH